MNAHSGPQSINLASHSDDSKRKIALEGSQENLPTIKLSPARSDPSGSSREGSNHGGLRSPANLTLKAARLVAAGLPWPDEPYVRNETRELVKGSKVKWNQDVNIHDTYEIISPLGTGGFAKVFKGKHKHTGQDVAIKHIEAIEEDDTVVVYKEIKHLTMLRQVKQVVTIYEVYESGRDVYIVMELCKGGELHACFDADKKQPLTYGDVGRIAVCMLILADAMHSRGFVHCDLKPENFCLAEPLGTGVSIVDNLRLIDFGLSQRVRGGQAIAGLAGSIPYMAPEIRTRMYDHKVDIWSIGVIVYTLLVGKLPFDGHSVEDIMHAAAAKSPDVSALHPAVADLVRWLLTKDPQKRPEAREALKHPWLQSTNKKNEGKDAFLQSVSNEVLQNLTVFAASNKLQRAFMHLAVGFMGKTEMQKMLQMFQALSMDQKKLLSTEEMTTLLTRDKEPEEATRIAHTVELVMGRDGALSIEDFVVASMNQYRNLSDAVIRTMFQALDRDADGWITAEDAFAALQPTGVHISVQELSRLFDKYGAKRRIGNVQSTSGVMTYHEFHGLMMPSVSQRFTHELDSIVTAFKQYHLHNPLQKLARRIVADYAPETKEIAAIKRAFEMMDYNKSGTLSRDELAKGIRTAGYVVSDSDLDGLFRTLDTDGTGQVRYHEFVAGAIDHNLIVGDHMLKWVFEFMDDDDSRTITGANLQTILDMMDWSDEEKLKMMEAACGPNCRECNLTFEQFKALMQSEGGASLPQRIVSGLEAANTSTNPRPSRVSKVPDPPVAEETEENEPLLLRKTQLKPNQSSPELVHLHAGQADLIGRSVHMDKNFASAPPEINGASNAAIVRAASVPGAKTCTTPKKKPSGVHSGEASGEAWRQPSSVRQRKGARVRIVSAIKSIFGSKSRR